MVISAELSHHGCRLVYLMRMSDELKIQQAARAIHRLCDEDCIVAVRCVPITSIEYPNRVVAYVWKRFEETDKATLVVELRGALATGQTKILLHS